MAAVIGVSALGQDQPIHSARWYVAFLLVIPVFFAARAGWIPALGSFVIAAGAQFVIAHIYLDREVGNQMAGMVYVPVLGMAVAFLVASVAGAASRLIQRRGRGTSTE